MKIPTKKVRKILAIIPARGGSKGLPGKNTLSFFGRPLIFYTVEAARQSKYVSDVLVSTDDARISSVARRLGAVVPFLRPAKLASDKATLWPAIRHAVNYWERNRNTVFDAIVVLQPTSPLRRADDIDGCLAQFYRLNADICCSVVASHDSPYFNMVEVPRSSSPFARACSDFMKGNLRRQDAPPVYSLNGAVYVIRRRALDTLQNQFRFKKLAIYEMPRSRSVDIDGNEDVALAKFWFKRQASQN